MNFKEMLLQAKVGREPAVIALLEMYKPLLVKYTFLEDVYKQKNPPFRVLKIGKLFRVPKKGFDEWLNGDL